MSEELKKNVIEALNGALERRSFEHLLICIDRLVKLLGTIDT